MRVASTEPPSEDGGEPRDLMTAERPRGALQRSRRPKTAERLSIPSARPLLRASFNGAAVRRRRRGDEVQSVAGPVAPASTEPPSEDGGEGAHRALGYVGCGSFNGAAVRRRRRGP